MTCDADFRSYRSVVNTWGLPEAQSSEGLRE
jgi:hypothetical protein